MAKKIPFRHQNDPKVKLKIRIRKDDTVKVIAGKDKGKTGKVLSVFPKDQKNIKGGIAEREASIAVSNVMIVTSGGVATRIGYRIEGTGAGTHHVRVAKKGGEILDKKA